MKKLKSTSLKIFSAAFLTVLLLGVTVKVNLDFPITMDDFKVTSNEAKAAMYVDMELADRTCWVTGQRILMCVHGEYVCDSGDQGTCSGS